MKIYPSTFKNIMMKKALTSLRIAAGYFFLSTLPSAWAIAQDASHYETATSKDSGDWGLLGLLGLIGLLGLKKKKARLPGNDD